MAKYGMVIDLQKCVGCGTCALACKSENNTPQRTRESSFNWADFILKVEGQFPNTKAATIPTLCNHCTNAPCVEVCPVTPKAMYKTKDGITMHNDERCIGCRLCQRACPYSSTDVAKADDQYSVISFNDRKAEPHGFWRNTDRLGKYTSSPVETSKKVGEIPPYHHKYKHPDYNSVRPKGVTEKCIFCDHRLKSGLKPNCVEACPANARIFGDLSNKNSEPSRLLKKHRYFRLKEDAGTEPNIYYVRSYKITG